MASGSTDSIFQFQISLNHIKPKIWRRIQVPANYTFQQLHWAIQDSMGWKSNLHNYHLHVFQINGPGSRKKVEIGIPNNFNKVISEERVKIDEIFTAPKTKASYEYDFGDEWIHTVTLEKILPALENTTYPMCIAGKRACPPEDCGGYEGYDEHLQIIKNPRHSEYEDHMNWLKSSAGNTDPEEFNPNSVVFHEGKM